MSCDPQRIVLTFVPSFDPCPRLPLSNPTSSAASNSCSILFISAPPTNQHCQFNAFNHPAPETAALMSCSLVATPFLCCVASNLHTRCVLRAYTCSCTRCITMQQHSQCVLASLLHASVSHGVPSPSISHRLPRQRALSLRARPGWTFERREGRMDGRGEG